MTPYHPIYDLSYIWCHTRAYFRFGWDFQISMDLHDHSHSQSTCRDDDLFTSAMTISQWSLSVAIQLGVRFSPFIMSSCFLLRDTFWIGGHGSIMDSDDRDYIFVEAWFDVIRFSRLVTHLMPYWGIFSFSIEICRFSLLHDRPLLRDTCWVEDFVSFHHGSPVAFSWVVSSNSHFLMSVWFLYGVIGLMDFCIIHFVRVHVRSSRHPYRVTHESSGRVGYIRCYTGAYFLLIIPLQFGVQSHHVTLYFDI